MARLARVVVPGIPHHVTQRGNRRQPVFFGDDDYAAYRSQIAASRAAAGVAVWGYCLMPNHVHLILVPGDAGGLRAALADAHRRYSRRINFRQGWRGYLWQGRFASVPMDERHLMVCSRYVEQNPVRAGLVRAAEDWRWSSARAHLAGADDGLVSVAPLLERAGNWAAQVAADLGEDDLAAVRSGERIGRPLGSDAFMRSLEQKLARKLARQRPGPKPREEAARYV
jgi:putative transposase